MDARIIIILLVCHLVRFILERNIVRNEDILMLEEGRELRGKGKIILVILTTIALVVITILSDAESNAFKWFFISLLVIAFGFNSFIEYTYRKGSKRYIVSLITMIVGVIMLYFLV
ncbi:DUF4181 domain-containing protein [Paenibacillus sp. GSMTC-2017]|uniref:DUF4181 domain-containing protein n=1 Tax=Paenibacillus sp. GSMTC-2017 TaxID=2794350 RepID=UPI0018D984E7|nr:DUF4181 domain-containing protein [Paenibacillus sp. GSMTC-2017]MBH5320410.1 DUF4181 domain-containing protein [Paenibacillus sp. GSMTC-2017]